MLLQKCYILPLGQSRGNDAAVNALRQQALQDKALLRRIIVAVADCYDVAGLAGYSLNINTHPRKEAIAELRYQYCQNTAPFTFKTAGRRIFYIAQIISGFNNPFF